LGHLLALGLLAFALPPLRAGDKPGVRVVPVDSEAAKYWTRWRGPSGQGVVPDGAYPDHWSATENVLWKSEVPGKGNSSPIIWKDRVIIYQELNGGGFIAAFDRKSGEQIWKTPRKETVGWGSPLAISVDGKDQIIVSSQDRVYAYDPENGKVIWTCGGNNLE